MGDLPIGELACRREFAHGGFAYREFAYRDSPIGDLPIRRGFDKQIHKQIYKQNTIEITNTHTNT